MKWVLRIVGGLVGLGVVLIATLAISLFASALRPSRPVGFQQIMVADPGRAPIPVSVWYPTDAKPGFVLLGSVGQRVASDGPVTGDRLPLVVISHGTGGAAISHADTPWPWPKPASWWRLRSIPATISRTPAPWAGRPGWWTAPATLAA